MNTAGATADNLDHEDDTTESPGEALSVAPDAVEVRRNAGLAALVGAAASAVAIAYLSRAARTGALLDWALVVVLGVLAVGYLRAFVDARTPLLVADAQGVRIRLGSTWQGLPWGALAEVVNEPRRGLLHDGRLTVSPRNPDRLLAELDASGRRQVALSSKLYGGPLVVPVGLSTRVTGAAGDLTAALRLLAGSRTEVVEVSTAPAVPLGDVLPEVSAPEDVEPKSPRRLPDPRPTLAAGIGSLAARFARTPAADDAAPEWDDDADEADDAQDDVEHTQPLVASATPSALREPRIGQRTEVTRDIVRGAVALDPAHSDDATLRELPEARELRRAGSVNLVEDPLVWGDRVRPIAKAGDAVAPLVIDDVGVEPADDPVVGPELCAARTRLGLSVDQLAERTRIRPHVIESIEVDDFVPCGGDFYARGHLRTLARVLGVDVAPLLSAYDERYADAPINPRRVFEAELATGLGGSIRSTRGGANWSLLIGALMALILAWSLARLVMDEPAELRQQAPQLNGSYGVTRKPAAVIAAPVRVKLSASGPVHVVVRDGNGEVVYAEDLIKGQTDKVKVQPPVSIRASDGGALEASVGGKDQGTLGKPGQPARATFAAR